MSPILATRASGSAIGYGMFGSAAAATSYESIATVTVGSGGAANVEFTSIPATYSHLQVRFTARGTASSGNDNILGIFNSDTGSNYAWHILFGNGGGAAAGASSSTTSFLSGRMSYANASASIFGVGVVDILDYANVNKYKTVRILTGTDENGAGIVLLNSGLWQNNSAITSFKLTPGAGGNFAQYSHFALYGIKSA